MSRLVFYTNLGSRKAQQLAHNPHISLLFPWHMLDRQVIFLGQAERLSTLEVLKYFNSRPKDSQIGAWCRSSRRAFPSAACWKANSLS